MQSATQDVLVIASAAMVLVLVVSAVRIALHRREAAKQRGDGGANAL